MNFDDLSRGELEKQNIVLIKKLEESEKKLTKLSDVISKLEESKKQLRDSQEEQIKSLQQKLKSLSDDDPFDGFDDVNDEDILYYEASKMMFNKANNQRNVESWWLKITRDLHYIAKKAVQNNKSVKESLSARQLKVINNFLKREKITNIS